MSMEKTENEENNIAVNDIQIYAIYDMGGEANDSLQRKSVLSDR